MTSPARWAPQSAEEAGAGFWMFTTFEHECEASITRLAVKGGVVADCIRSQWVRVIRRADWIAGGAAYQQLDLEITDEGRRVVAAVQEILAMAGR